MIRLSEEPREFEYKSVIPKSLLGQDQQSADFKRMLKDYRALLSITEYIDFECNFDKNGVCREKNPRYERAAACCCNGCVHSNGYNPTHAPLLLTPGELPTFKKKWDKHNGFWREGKGCILPRQQRSTTCVFYCCLSSGKRESKGTAIYRIHEAAKYLKNQMYTMIYYKERK